jgi:hypothetical protein
MPKVLVSRDIEKSSNHHPIKDFISLNLKLGSIKSGVFSKKSFISFSYFESLKNQFFSVIKSGFF